MISVLLCTYNQEKYISKTLDSIISQKCNLPFKIYINDDRSCDSTWCVISHYKEKYPEIIDAKLNKQNLGIPLNFYDVLFRSKGDYVCLCGGDDLWIDVNKLQEQIDILENHKDIGLVFSDYYICDENDKFLNKIETNVISYAELLRNNNICASTICLRRCHYYSFISDVNPMSKQWKMEDYPLLLWMSLHFKLYHLNKITTVYRLLHSSVTHSNDIVKRLQFEDTLYSIKTYFNERKPVICDEELIRIREYNKAHLCLVYDCYKEYRIVVNDLSLTHIKALVYRLIGINRFIFKYATKFC